MKKVYFLDFCDPKVFNGKGKFVATSKARNDVTSIVKRCLETIYVPIIRHSTNKVLGPLEIIIRIYLALLKIPKGSYVLIQYPFVNLKAFRIISSRFKNFNTIAVIRNCSAPL